MPDFKFSTFFRVSRPSRRPSRKSCSAGFSSSFSASCLIYLGKKGVLEALLMIPMGLGMAAVNAGVLFFEGGRMGTLFLDPLVSETECADERPADQLAAADLHVHLLQRPDRLPGLPRHRHAARRGLRHAAAVPQHVSRRSAPRSGTLVTFPLGVWLGLPANQAAATATIGGADGPMVLFASLILAPEIFVPITVVGYLYLGLTYGGYPYLIKADGAEIDPRDEHAGREGAADLLGARSWSSRSSPAPRCACCSRSRHRCSCRCSSASSSARAA